MEKSFESSKSSSSLAMDFANDLKHFQDVDELFELYSDSLKRDPNFEANMSQLARMANIAADPGINELETIMNFMAGELLGYTALVKIEGESVYEKVHEALRDLYAQDRLRANNHILQQQLVPNLISTSEDFRQRLTGFFINDTMDKYFGHETISSEEMDVVFEILRNITDKEEEDSVYDALRGYLFIRSSLSWHEKYKDFRLREKQDRASKKSRSFANFTTL